MLFEKKVTYGESVQTAELQKLWVTCFPEDADGFADFFLQRMFRTDRSCVVWTPDGSAIESALYWLPCTFRDREKSYPMIYIYAMGTLPTCRRQGNLRAMLDFTEAHCRKNGIAGMLLHALETSRPSVEAFGMKPLLVFRGSTDFRPDVRKKITPLGTDPGFAAFSALRKAYLETQKRVIVWEDPELSFIYEDLCRDGKIGFFRAPDGSLFYRVSAQKDGTGCTECSRPELLRTPDPAETAAHIKLLNSALSEADFLYTYFNLMLK